MSLDAVIPTEGQILDWIRNEPTRNQGYRSLLRLYQERIYWQIRRLVDNHEDASDISQETWVRVLKSIENFKEESTLFTWIYRIATNLSINHLKKEKRELEKRGNVPQLQIVQNEELNGELAWRLLQEAVRELPEKQQLVFNMRYFEGMKYDDISRLLGTSVGALKASYHLAVKKVEKHVRKEV